MSRVSLVALASTLLLLLLPACSAGTSTPRAAPTPERPYTSCEELVPDWLPPDWELHDAELVNLGGRTFGRVSTYRGADSQVEVYVGADALEAFEDLDFEAEPLQTPVRLYRLHSTAVQPGLVALTWNVEAQEGTRCSDRSVLGRQVPVEDLVRVADSLAAEDA